MDWQGIVTNLLNKAEDNAVTAAERQAYSEKAAYLMAKYGITELLNQPTNAPLNVDHVVLILKSPYPKLRAVLASEIARALSCRAVRTGQKVLVYGLAHDLRNFSRLFVSLWIQAMLSLAASEKPPHVHGKTHNHSYLLGFISEVTSRVHRATQRATTETTQTVVSNALVLQNRETAVDKAVSEAFPRLVKGSPTRATSRDSYADGTRAGRMADINQPRLDNYQSTTARKALR